MKNLHPLPHLLIGALDCILAVVGTLRDALVFWNLQRELRRILKDCDAYLIRINPAPPPAEQIEPPDIMAFVRVEERIDAFLLKLEEQE